MDTYTPSELMGQEPPVTYLDGLFYCRDEDTGSAGVGRVPERAMEQWRIAEAIRRNAQIEAGRQFQGWGARDKIRFPDAVLMAARRRMHDGETGQAVAESLSISRSSLYTLFRQAGIPMKPANALAVLFAACLLLSVPHDSHAATVNLAWNASLVDATHVAPTGYRVYCGTASGTYTIKNDAGKVTAYTVQGLLDGTKYFCAVTAYTSAAESGFSNEASFTTPVSIASPTITATVTLPAAGNDNFNAPAVLCGCAQSGTASGDTTQATRETGEPKIMGNPGGHSAWFSWTAPKAGPVQIDTIGSPGGIDTMLAVYTGSGLTALTLVAADDDSGGSRASKVSFTAVAGTRYLIQLDGYAGTGGPLWSGPYKLNWSQP